MLYPIELRALIQNLDEHSLSGRRDSNLRPPAPKAGALTGLRYAPNLKKLSKIESKIYSKNRKKTINSHYENSSSQPE
jgi:hypothetical protein